MGNNKTGDTKLQAARRVNSNYCTKELRSINDGGNWTFPIGEREVTLGALKGMLCNAGLRFVIRYSCKTKTKRSKWKAPKGGVRFYNPYTDTVHKQSYFLDENGKRRTNISPPIQEEPNVGDPTNTRVDIWFIRLADKRKFLELFLGLSF